VKAKEKKIKHRFNYTNQLHGMAKDKAIPLQASTGPEGSRRLRLPGFKTIGT